MSGHNVAYHLRMNKYVERRLFLDILDRVRMWNGVSDYFYVSLGGRFLEDFRYINDHLGIEKMRSLETHEATWQRQQFNSPFGFIDCVNESAATFVSEFDSLAAEKDPSKFIVWLDYAKANERHQQLQEFQELVSKMRPGDVAKITMNANYCSKASRHDFANTRLHEGYLLTALKDDLEEFTPSGGIKQDHLKPASYAKFLADAVRISATKASETAHDIVPIPLLSCRYADGEHQMLTVCAIIADAEIAKSIEADDEFRRNQFRSHVWDQVHDVSVPVLSMKERRTINSLIGKMNSLEIHDQFGFLFADSAEESSKLIASYIDHYRRYPGFTPMPTM